LAGVGILSCRHTQRTWNCNPVAFYSIATSPPPNSEPTWHN
jgi:hypothetical protein